MPVLCHPGYFCQHWWLQVGGGLAQVALCLRCCFLGCNHQLGGVCARPGTWKQITIHSVHWPPSASGPGQVCQGRLRQEHLPLTTSWGQGSIRATGGPGSSTEQASFSAQLRLRCPCPWLWRLQIPSFLEARKGQHEHPADPSSGGHPGGRGGGPPGRAEPRRENPGLYSGTLLLPRYFLLGAQGKWPPSAGVFGPNC